jgi:SpoVK/Ycf46/Vps4 family AAA+-type ATPase
MTTEAVRNDGAIRARHHERYLRRELERLRLLLGRRVLWLRQRWAAEASSEPTPVITDARADRLLAGPDPAAERRFQAAHPDARRIGERLEDLERELAADLVELRASGHAAPLDTLQRLFGLSAFERDVVLLCLAPELDSDFQGLYGYVQDDATRTRPTFELALSLFVNAGEQTEPAWHSLQPHAPLRRFRLVVTGDGDHLSTLGLRLPERVVGYIQGFNHLDPEVSDVVHSSLATPLPPSLQTWLERLERWAAPRLADGGAPRLNLVGPAGCGKHALASALSDRLGLELRRLDVTRVAGRGHDVARVLEREAALLGLAFHVDAGDLDEAGTRLLDTLLGDLRAFLFVASRKPWATRWPVMRVTLDRLPSEERRVLWERALAGRNSAVSGETITALVQQFELGPAMVQRALVQAQGRARLRAPDDAAVTGDDLWAACREQAAVGMDGLAQPVVPGHDWDDIVVPDDVRRQLEEIAAQVAGRHRVYTAWGFGRTLGRGRGISALFAGPSGTGKTMAAEVLAGRLRLDLYRIDLAGVVSKYIGETEKNLARVFDAAERSGAVLFFDEADALFGKRSEVRDSHDRYANIEIDYLLQRMEEYRGLAILATNVKAHLDPAFLRRLRFVVEFVLPDAEHRRRIWRKAFPPAAPLDGVDWDVLARLELTGGNITNIALNAAFLAAEARAPIGMSHLMRAAVREYAKEEKLVTRAEFGPYHEAGRR